MKKISQQLDDTLLDYLDGLLSSAEKQRVEHLLQSDEAIANRLRELRELGQSLREFTLEQPSKNFTQVVMRKLDQYPARTGLSIRNGIFLLAGVLATAGIATVLISAGVFDGSSTSLNLNQFELSGKYISKPLPSIPFNGKVILNTIVFLNVALGFLVLDRAILKPFFQRRRNSGALHL